MNECCPENTAATKGKVDWLLYSTLGVIVLAVILHFASVDLPYLSTFSHAVTELLKIMWWGMAFGIIAVGIMQHVPREYFQTLLGRGDTAGGIFRAALAGLLLDLCSHGILMVGAKLYERGASLGQVMTFLIASPWNSITLTLILISLVGLKLTLLFILGSAIIAITTGFMIQYCVRKGILSDNPNTEEISSDFDIKSDARQRLKGFKFTKRFVLDTITGGFREGRMVLRWLFVGVIIAALIRAFVDTDTITTFFGPTILGLLLTLLATTIIEVCSEGSAPIGAELVNRAGAPGNGFVFLMAGVSTDYTEILVLREFTKSWKAALFLPLLTVPQVLLLGWLMNNGL